VVLRGAEIAADRALAIALVDEVTDRADDVDAVVNAAVASLSQVSGVELAVRRRLLIEAPTTSFEDALGTHLAACDRELLRTARIRDHGQVAR
jgi:isomerase DpgB